MQTQGNFTSTGLQTASVTWDPPAAADRYGIEVMAGHSGMHSDADQTLTIRGNNANAIFDIPDAPAVGPGVDEEWAMSQTRGTQQPLVKKPGVNNYRESIKETLIKAGWFPPGG